MPDEEEEIAEGGRFDTNVILYSVGIVFVILIGLGFYTEHTQAAYQGLTLIGDIAALPEAILNGFTGLINALFHAIDKAIPIIRPMGVVYGYLVVYALSQAIP